MAPLANPKFTGTISGNTNFTVDSTGNLTAYSITSNSNITCTDLLYAGGTSSATKISNLAPYTGSSSCQAGSITSLTNITSPSCQVNGNATITGDILLGLPQAYLSTTLRGKANLSGATFTGTIAAPTITLNGTSIATSLAACAQKTSGSIASTTTFQTIYTPINQRGCIYVAAGGS